MSTLLQEIEAQITGAKVAVEKQNVGVVSEISDGVAKIEVWPTRCSTRCSTLETESRVWL